MILFGYPYKEENGIPTKSDKIEEIPLHSIPPSNGFRWGYDRKGRFDNNHIFSPDGKLYYTDICIVKRGSEIIKMKNKKH